MRNFSFNQLAAAGHYGGLIHSIVESFLGFEPIIHKVGNITICLWALVGFTCIIIHEKSFLDILQYVGIFELRIHDAFTNLYSKIGSVLQNCRAFQKTSLTTGTSKQGLFP